MKCSALPVITLEVSKTSQHLGWYYRVGSGTQACTQVSLAAVAVGFTSMELRGRTRSLLGAKGTSPSWHWSRVRGCREIASSMLLVWSHGWRMVFLDMVFPSVSHYSDTHCSLSLYPMASLVRQTQFLYMFCYVLCHLISVIYQRRGDFKNPYFYSKEIEAHCTYVPVYWSFP